MPIYKCNPDIEGYRYDTKSCALRAKHPHMAFYTAEDVRAMIFNSAGALLAFSRGEETPFEVRA